ncbi:MAG: HPr family phosphocarrier protein [Agathobacter sp.]|nr:HPr family phosphocarrier protein [Agathobacter sp.]
MYENEKVISFDTFDDVQEFVRAASKCDFEIDLRYNRNLIDAKSLLGVMAIGLSNNVTVCYGGNNQSFQNTIEKFSIA